MRKIFYFLGSIYFAVILIGLAALFVIAGTFLESMTDSHQYAARLTYGSPIFKALLLGFFINILLSSLRRWPFQRKHIPFLITHLGLLMILSGCLIKSYLGLQGIMLLTEGSGSHEILLPDTYIVKIEKKDPKRLFGIISGYFDLDKKISPFPDLQIEVVDYAPHGSETFEGKENSESLIVYDRGFGGYAVQKKITTSKSSEELEKEGHALIEKQLEIAIENEVKLSLPLEILHQACKTDFPKNCLAFLVEWKKSGAWLYPENGPTFSWEKNVIIPTEWSKGCLWASSLFDDKDPLASLQRKGCPLPQSENPLKDLTRQIFSAGDQLPDSEDQSQRKARLLSALFRAYEIHLDNITPDLPKEEIALVETPIHLTHQKLPPNKKLEDNLPLITLKVNQEIFSLLYHPTDLKLKTLSSGYLFHLQPQSVNIPYHLRLRNARQINYAHSTQAFSYEGDLIIIERRSGIIEEKTISMNQVHETWEGYRFYLSSISPGNETAVKRVQLAVNYDPAKYYLTYPGGLIVALGSILLFWRGRRSKL